MPSSDARKMFNLQYLSWTFKCQELQLWWRSKSFEIFLFLNLLQKLMRVCQFVEQIVRNLKEALRECQWESARLMVRFISDMVNCHIVSASSLLQLYDSFIDAAMEQGVPQVRRDW